jgi:transposase
VIILEYSEAALLSEAAQRAGCSLNTAKRWIRRFSRLRDEGLDDQPRSGRPPSHGNDAKLALAALATAAAPDPLVCWSHQVLADELADAGHAVSASWVGRTLADLELDITHTRGWLNRTGDVAEFAARAKDVCDLLVHGPDDGGVIVCIDEKTGIQAIERLFEDLGVRAGQRRRIEFEYKRHGVVHLQLAYRNDTGEVLWWFVDSNNSDNFCWFLGQVSRWVGGGRQIHLVMDNGSSHVSKQTRAWLAERPRFVVHHTPKHASWLNPAELVFSSLTRAVIKGRSSSSRANLKSAIDRWLEYSRQPRVIAWTFEWRE